MITKDEIIKRLEANSYAAEYAAYNYNGSKREHLIPGAIESTCPWMQLLIEIRNNEQMVKELKESSVVIGNVMRSIQEKKKLWEERQSKYIDEEKSLTDDTDFDDERLILIENINLSEQIINDLEEIINQNFA